jgi:hypothetical protein
MDYYDREKLYTQVWAETLTKVAARYGVSAVALGKVCRKLKVPLPGRGYWAKKAHGHSVPQTPLFKATDVRPIAHLKSPEARDPLATVAESPEFVRIAQVESRIQSFSTSGDELHPAVLRATKVLSKSDPDERYILRMAEPEWLDIRVSEGALDRALAIMNTLICMAESEGFRVVADSEQRETMHFCAKTKGLNSA